MTFIGGQYGAVVFFQISTGESIPVVRPVGKGDSLSNFLIIRLALLEFIVLFAAVLVMQGAGMAVLAVALLVLLGMSLLRPTPEKVASEWGLSEKERYYLWHPQVPFDDSAN